MSELRPHGRELLDAARRERSLTQAERARLLEDLHAAALAARERDDSWWLSRRLSRTGKLLVLLGLAALIALGVYLAGHVGPRAH